MKSIKATDIFNAVVALLSVIIGGDLVSSAENKTLGIVFLTVAAVMIVFLACVFGYRIYISDKQKGESRELILRGAKRHLEYLMKLARKSDKAASAVRKNAYGDDYCKYVLDGKTEAVAEDKTISDATKLEKRVAAVGIQEKRLSDLGSREVTDAIIDCIKDVDKVMLQVEQPHIRYELGKYVAANASDVWDKVKALVDMQGWTAVLMRKYSLMEKALAAACETIEQIKKELPSVDVVLNGNSSEKEISDTYNCLLYETRVYRHYAAAPKYRRNNLEKAFVNIKKAAECIDELKRLAPVLSEKQNREVLRTEYGVVYGIAELYYDIARDKAKKGLYSDARAAITKALEKTDSMCDSFGQLAELDAHRALKVRVLENKIFFVVRNLFKETDCDGAVKAAFERYKGSDTSETENRLDENLDYVLGVLNHNIYADEAIESYLQQRIMQVYKIAGSRMGIKFGEPLTHKE